MGFAQVLVGPAILSACLFLQEARVVWSQEKDSIVRPQPSRASDQGVRLHELSIRFSKDSLSPTFSEQPEARLKAYLPPDRPPSPVVLFLTDLGSDSNAYDYLGKHWASAGFACFFLEPLESERKSITGVPITERIHAYRKLAHPNHVPQRVAQAREAAEVLHRWGTSAEHPLYGELDWNRVALGGHGFGAVVALHLLAETHQNAKERVTTIPSAMKPQSLCVIGPTTLDQGEQELLSTLGCLPGLVISGDLDESLIRRPDPIRRNGWFLSYPRCAEHYELRLLDGKHLDFTNTPLRFGRQDRNPFYHPLIQSISTAFLHATLGGEPGARRWLEAPEIAPEIRKTVRWETAVPN